MDSKRLFFGLSMQAPWPESWPEGRVLAEPDRHLTLAFLGQRPKGDIDLLLKCPVPAFVFAPCGSFDSCLMLPEEKRPHVFAWHVRWESEEVRSFQRELVSWLHAQGVSLSDRPWLSHMTIARAPFDADAWQSTFHPLPCYASAFHLFESLGSSKYRSLWAKPFQVPFEEISHTADIAFLVYAKDLSSLYQSAALALAFKYPPFLSYIEKSRSFSSLEDIIIALNYALSCADIDLGCPFKAVSFHGEITETAPNFIQWEMIVDV